MRRLDLAASTIVFFVLGVSQPLLDLLGRNAEFFLARAAPAGDIVVLGLVVGIAAPLAAAGVVVGVDRLAPRLGPVLHLGLLWLLGLLAFHHLLRILAPGDHLPWLRVVLAGVFAAAVVELYRRHEALRFGVRVAAVAPLVAAGSFLLVSPTSQLVRAEPSATDPGRVEVTDPVPVVIVIFDELPLASLIDGEGRIEAHYPNFRRLAATATWYRNAVGVEQQTEEAVPAILTGRRVADRAIPTAANHPLNLFTLLADTYLLDVHESVTALCPAFACEEERARRRASTRRRWAQLLADLRIVAGHLFLPGPLTEGLPPIDSTWADFEPGTEEPRLAGDDVERFWDALEEEDRRVAIRRFVDGLVVDDEPRLSFLHALVPHVPWSYLPSGQRHGGDRAPGSEGTGWGDDPWLVAQGYQRHLLMVGYADTALGAILDRLEATGRFDETLLVVLADHGVAIRPGVEHRRLITPDTVGEIAAVPLFVKYPGQREGRIDDVRALTVDVLPTIADVLGVELPWVTDGVSLRSPERARRTESTMEGSRGPVTFGVDGREVLAAARRKVELFGPDGPFGLAPRAHRELLGRPVAAFEVREPQGASVFVPGLSALQRVDLDGETLPTWIRGTLLGGDVEGRSVGIAVNGRLAAISLVRPDAAGRPSFGAMLPPDTLREGANELEFFLVLDDGSLQSLPR